MDKRVFREICLKRLEKASGRGRLYRSRLVMRRVEYIIKKYNPKSVLFYMPISHEPDLRPLFRRFAGRMKIYVPFMEGKSFKLVQYRLPLRKKRFGIIEPNNSHFYLPKIDMAVVPVVGVDGKMRRIGFGKGMYDRFFASLKERPITLFVQISKCYTKEIVTDSFDIEADYYITPEDIIVRGKRYVDRDFDRRCRSSR
ncbi:5-formyltetrahydrofolate cyclo-ligase [Hydrogenimonas sp.]|nr:5-formyltetrahydrofolate cyclo-ligase [Hydrogenimonas sp.]